MIHQSYSTLKFRHPSEVKKDETPGLCLSSTGETESLDTEAAIRQGIVLLLSTRPGERVMNPEYGCNIHRLIFSPMDDTMAGLAIHYVRQAIERWESRIEIIRIDATRDNEDPTKLKIALEYKILATNKQEILSYPLDVSGS